MAPPLKKSMVLDGIGASEALDSSGEILSLKGLSIESLLDGTGVLNYEHRGDSSEGASANDIIGHISYARKIFGPDDCENDRQLMYWNQVQLPFLYIQAELFDGEGHPGAQAAAALIRYYQRRKMPILMRYSIEGSTLERDGNILKRTIARRVAATIKPCNRSCVSGVLSDEGFSASSEEKSSGEELKTLVRFENPNSKKLGSFEGLVSPVLEDPLEKMREAVDALREMNALNKALEAGGYNVRPTSLTGGSALQVEHVDGGKRKKFIKNQALAALRDWGGRGDLEKFLKHRLPDVSDEFLQHFTNLVQDYHLKKFRQMEDDLLKAVAGKAVKAPAKPKPAAPAPAAPKSRAKSLPTVEAHAEKALPALTVQGKPVPMPKVPVKEPYFDPTEGAVVTPRGVFHLSTPTKPHPHLAAHVQSVKPGADVGKEFDSALQKNRGPWLGAMENFVKLNSHFRAGTMKPGIVSNAVAFALLSPGIPVPMQEMMYSHWADSLKHHGLEAANTPDEFNKVYNTWISQNGNLPDHSRDYFLNLPPSHRARVITKAGVPGRFQKPEKFREFYHKYLQDDHQGVMDSIRAGGGDARQMARLLSSVNGIAPKLARYAPLMMGAGNLHVPDTHNIRHMFGLRPDAPGTQNASSPDALTGDYLKEILLNKGSAKAADRSHKMLEGIDDHYFANHPAVKAVLADPDIGHHFASDPRQAIGPAFWWHWASTTDHEDAIGTPNSRSSNGGTGHAPWFDHNMSMLLGKNEGAYDPELHLRTAMLMNKIVHEQGEQAAMLYYYRFIVPALLRNDERAEMAPVEKMERIAAKLRKNAEQMTQLPPVSNELPEGAVKFRGKHVMPGEVEITSGAFKGSKAHHLGEDGTGHIMVRPHGSTTLHKLPVDHEGKSYRVVSKPFDISEPAKVDSAIHGDPTFTKTHAQKVLMHGIDLNARMQPGRGGVTNDLHPEKTGWYDSALGSRGYVKPDLGDDSMWEDWDPALKHEHDQFSGPHREGLFHTMANEFFGLGQHVPTTAVFKHPTTGESMSVMERVKGGQHYENDDDESEFTLQNAHHNGTLDKLAIMDAFMGNSDRNPGNYMLSNQPAGVHLIDNALCLDFNNPYSTSLWDHQHTSAVDDHKGTWLDRQIHPQAAEWALQLNHSNYLQKMVEHGVPRGIAKAGFMRMMGIQQAILEAKTNNQPVTRGHIVNAVNKALPADKQATFQKLNGPLNWTAK